MPAEWRYRGRVVSAEDVAFIRQFIAQNPGASRRRLSAKLCEAWQWKQANGALRDMVCRGLLLMLHRAGEIELPPVRQVSLNPFVERERPAPMLLDTTVIAGALNALQPIELEQVRRTGDEPLFNSLMEHYHYLGYEQPVGEHLKYLAWATGRPIACLAWSSAPRHLGSRDRYIGWNAEARRQNIPAVGAGAAPGLASSGQDDPRPERRLGTDVRPSDLLRRNLHRSRPVSRNVLSGR
jgi:hypothetical protein